MELTTFPYIDGDDVFDIPIIEIENQVWFVANAVCNALDIKNSRDAISELDPDEKLMSVLTTSGQRRSTNLVSESGLYALVFKSRKANAKRFQKWVTKEVLPSIRKTGSYGRYKIPVFAQRAAKNFHKVDKGYFSVISELFNIVYAPLEYWGHTIPDKAKDGKEIRMDVSVGSCFANWLKTHHPDKANSYRRYPHDLTEFLCVDARQYPRSMKHIFAEYVEDYWIPNNAEAYFKERDPEALKFLQRLLKRNAS